MKTLLYFLFYFLHILSLKNLKLSTKEMMTKQLVLDTKSLPQGVLQLF